jgi:hypothetical protein
MWENERLKNVENQISGYSGYLKMWKNDVEWMSVNDFCHIFEYACFFFNFLFPSVDCNICCAFVNSLIIFK